MSAQPRISAHVEQAPILKAEKVKPSLLLKLAIDQIRWKTVSRLLNLVHWEIILKHLENTGIPDLLYFLFVMVTGLSGVQFGL